MKGDILLASTEFKLNKPDRSAAGRKLLPLLTPGLRVDEVTDLLASPSAKEWGYMLFYSSYLRIIFDTEDRVTTIDCTEGACTGSRAEILSASIEFKAGNLDRRAAARLLVPEVKECTSGAQVAELLGMPDRAQWVYRLSPRSSITLTLNVQGAVEQVETDGI